MTSGIPWWARMMMSIDHSIRMLSHAVGIVRDETMLAFIPPDRRSAVTTAIYDGQRSYGPGGELFALGLYEWERRLIATPPFPPPPARILLGGAGGGREVVPLRDRGYEVWSFEPSPELVAGAQVEISARAGASLIVGDYDDLVRAVRGESTRLSSIASQDYDAIILGWGSLSYVVPEATRLSLLVALKTLAPNAPLILSFIPRLASDERGRPAALRRGLRRVLTRLGGQPASDNGELFVPWGGFASALPLDEIERLALQSGYRPAILETEPYGHALLVPA